jgi:hypothetical protein
MPFSFGAREVLLVGFAGALQRPIVAYVVVSLLERVISFSTNVVLFALIVSFSRRRA